VVTRTLAGVIGADDVSLAGGTATFADANAGTGKIGDARGRDAQRRGSRQLQPDVGQYDDG